MGTEESPPAPQPEFLASMGLSAGTVACEFHLILIKLNLSGHVWLLATTLEETNPEKIIRFNVNVTCGLTTEAPLPINSMGYEPPVSTDLACVAVSGGAWLSPSHSGRNMNVPAKVIRVEIITGEGAHRPAARVSGRNQGGTFEK